MRRAEQWPAWHAGFYGTVIKRLFETSLLMAMKWPVLTESSRKQVLLNIIWHHSIWECWGLLISLCLIPLAHSKVEPHQLQGHLRARRQGVQHDPDERTRLLQVGEREPEVVEDPAGGEQVPVDRAVHVRDREGRGLAHVPVAALQPAQQDRASVGLSKNKEQRHLLILTSLSVLPLEWWWSVLKMFNKETANLTTYKLIIYMPAVSSASHSNFSFWWFQRTHLFLMFFK